MAKREWKSRTLSLTDEEWEVIRLAAVKRGFGEKGRGRAIVQLCREEIARPTAKPDQHDAGS